MPVSSGALYPLLRTRFNHCLHKALDIADFIASGACCAREWAQSHEMAFTRLTLWRGAVLSRRSSLLPSQVLTDRHSYTGEYSMALYVRQYVFITYQAAAVVEAVQQVTAAPPGNAPTDYLGRFAAC
jgi:hypothetical protein